MFHSGALDAASCLLGRVDALPIRVCMLCGLTWMILISPIHSPCQSSSRTFGIGDGYKAGWDRRYVLSILGDHPVYFQLLPSYPHDVFSVESVFRLPPLYAEYSSYHTLHTAPSSSSRSVGATLSSLPPVCANPPSSDGHVKSLCPIKPAPTTTSGKKTSSSKKDSSG